jgi:hypothetical protein
VDAPRSATPSEPPPLSSPSPFAADESSLLLLVKARVEGIVRGLREHCAELAERCAAAEQLVSTLQADARPAAAPPAPVAPAARAAPAWHAAAADAAAHAAELGALREEHIAALAALRAEHARALDTALSVSQGELAVLLASAPPPAAALLEDRTRSRSRARSSERAARAASLAGELEVAREMCTALTSERNLYREEAEAAHARAEESARASLSATRAGSELEAAKAECAALTVTLTQCTALSSFAEELQAAREACAALTSERDHWRAKATALQRSVRAHEAPQGAALPPDRVRATPPLERATASIAASRGERGAGVEIEALGHGVAETRAVVGTGGEEVGAEVEIDTHARGVAVVRSPAQLKAGAQRITESLSESLRTPTKTVTKSGSRPAAVSDFFAERRSRAAAPTPRASSPGRSEGSSPSRSPGRGVGLLDEVLAAQRRMSNQIIGK